MNGSIQEASIKRFLFSKIFISLILIGLVAIFLVWISFSYFNRGSDLNDMSEIKKVVAKHYLLPVDEEPALATVTDKSKLNTDFLAVAENEDKLLVYKNNKVVILYRPSIDRVVRVGPVSIADTTTEQK